MRYLLIILSLFNFLFCGLAGMWKSEINDADKVLYFKFIENPENSGTYISYKYYKDDKKLRINNIGSWIIINGDICMFKTPLERRSETICGKLVFDKKRDILILEDGGPERTYNYTRVIEKNIDKESQWGK